MPRQPAHGLPFLVLAALCIAAVLLLFALASLRSPVASQGDTEGNRCEANFPDLLRTPKDGRAGKPEYYRVVCQ